MGLWDGPFKPLDPEASKLLDEAVKNIRPLTENEIEELKVRIKEHTRAYCTTVTWKDRLKVFP